MSVTLFAKSKKALALESPTDERPSKRAHADSEAHEPPTTANASHLTSASIGKQALASPSQIVSSKCGWEDLRMAPWVYKVCSELRYKNPTPIQQATIPLILDGKNVLGRAETGSGKTAAFGLPILHKLALDPVTMFALVLTPTRELALQIGEQLRTFGAPVRLRLAMVIGGRDMVAQALELDHKPHIVVATPGRLADHINSTATAKLNRIRYLVLDEADRLLDGGFDADLRAIIQACNPSAQLLLYSATVPPNLEQRLGVFMKHVPKFVEVAANEKQTTVATLKQEYLFMPARVKITYLTYLVRKFESASAIVFCAKCRTAEVVSLVLRELGVKAVSLHSQLSQEQRAKALEQFKSRIAKILVATDVASRGLDIPEVELVVSYDLPAQAEVYLHRVGRTARAGRGGTAITLVTQHDTEQLKAIEGFTGVKLTEHENNEDEVLKNLHDATVAEKIAQQTLVEIGFGEKQKNNRLKRKQQ